MASSVTSKKLVRSISGYRMVTVDERMSSPFRLSEPEWVKDDQCSHCQNMECQTKFVLLKRKHHCRRCGKCYCDSCSSQKIALHRMCFIDPVRHCSTCYNITKRENEFFEKSLKILQNGGMFRLHIDDGNSNAMPGEGFSCKLSQDERFLEFDTSSGQEKIHIDNIESVQIVATETDVQGNRLGTGIAVQYKNSIGNPVVLKMNVDNGPERKQGMIWVATMLKAFKLVYESRRNSR